MHLFSLQQVEIGIRERELQLVSLRNVAAFRDIVDTQKCLNLAKPGNVWEMSLHFLQSGTRFGEGLLNRSLNSLHLSQKLKTRASVQIGQ